MKTFQTPAYNLSLFLDSLKLKDSEKIIQNILNQILEDKEIGFAGFKDKSLLKSTLERFMNSWKDENQYFEINEKQIEYLISISKETLEALKLYSKSKKHLFLFPCFDKFTIEKMNGLGGFCPWKNVIFIFFNPQKGWERTLKETIIHEFAHSISPFYNGGEYSIGEGFVFEGLAEHFRERIFGGESAPYSKALNETKIKKYLEELKFEFNSVDLELYMEVFYGTGRYPNWAGYSIGYYLVEKYLKDKGSINWNELLRINPKYISTHNN